VQEVISRIDEDVILDSIVQRPSVYGVYILKDWERAGVCQARDKVLFILYVDDDDIEVVTFFEHFIGDGLHCPSLGQTKASVGGQEHHYGDLPGVGIKALIERRVFLVDA